VAIIHDPFQALEIWLHRLAQQVVSAISVGTRQLASYTICLGAIPFAGGNEKVRVMAKVLLAGVEPRR